jgi:hypothetical protein
MWWIKWFDFLCKLGFHSREMQTYFINIDSTPEDRWASFWNGEYNSHYECRRCGVMEEIPVGGWDGTDGY